MPRLPGRPPQAPQQPINTRQQVIDAAVARVVENIATSLRAMVPEHAIRRLIELEVRAAVQALPPVMVERAVAPQVPQGAPQPQTRPRTEPGPLWRLSG